MWRQDNKDEQLYYLLPDLWPSLSDPKILAALQRFKDERLAHPGIIRMLYIVIPSLEMLPEAFRPLFDIHYDNGLTEEQAKAALIESDNSVLKFLGITVMPENVDAMVKLAVGLTYSDLNRMVSYAVVTQRKNDFRNKNFTTQGMIEWRKLHGKPEVA